MKKKRINKAKLFTVIIFLLVIGSLISLNTYLIINKKNHVEEKKIIKNQLEFVNHIPNSSIAKINIPAVDRDGNGVSTVLTVEATPGSGKTLVDIDSLLFWADTQNSIRTAKFVAANVTGIDTNKYDLFYDVKANASVIAGPSAGSAITIATIAALENKNLRSDVMITGSINHDGTIGPVGDVLAKANAAKNAKANIFLVPLLQSKEITYEQREHCQKFGFSEFCSIEQIPKQVTITDEVDITVKEVSNIKEALEYFY